MSLADYELGKCIGKGQYSSVYQARRKSSQEQVALKRVEIFNLKEKTRKKCLREVKLLQSLDHPHIVKCMDSFIEENELVIVLEMAEKGDLRRLVKRAMKDSRPFPERDVWIYFYQIAHAIQHMHERRIMHRDIKPANIFITASGVLKLGDLGLGRHFSFESVQAFSKVGTPLYMSPDVLEGGGYDWKSDVWSIGVLLYELAMLKSPFMEEGNNLYQIYQKIKEGDYPPMSDAVSPQLRNLVDRMLQVDPKKRADINEVCRVAKEAVRSQNRQAKLATAAYDFPVAVMEAVLDKLKLLHYENHFCRVRKIPQLHQLYFVIPDKVPSNQFLVMVNLMAWLVNVCMGATEHVKYVGPADDPNQSLNDVLVALKELGIEAPSPAKLKQPYGFHVCTLLNDLVDAALSNLEFTFLLPQGPRDAAAEDDDDDPTAGVDEYNGELLGLSVKDLGIEGRESEDSMTALVDDDEVDEAPFVSSAHGGDEDEDEDEFVVHETPAAGQPVVQQAALEATVDPRLWQIEVENVAPALRVSVPADNSWRSRLVALQRDLQTASAVVPDLAAALSAVAARINKEASVIDAREATIERQLSSLVEERATAAAALDAAQSEYAQSSTRLTALTEELADLQQTLADTSSEIERVAQDRADATPVARIKAAIKQIKREVAEIQTRTGVLTAMAVNYRTQQRHRGTAAPSGVPRRGAPMQAHPEDDDDDDDEFDA